jgi:hypothetical protein
MRDWLLVWDRDEGTNGTCEGRCDEEGLLGVVGGAAVWKTKKVGLPCLATD